MRKIITIGGKEYTIKSSAYTQFKYKNDTGRKFLNDLQSIVKIAGKSQEEQIDMSDDLTYILLRIAFVMIEEADKTQVTSFEDFLKSIDVIYDDIGWINEVVEVATSPLSGRIQVPQN